ncbi:MAG: tetratricopeptide repeat protein [Anaerolineae bacterium]|nr:tetratricopeptide repeat protein [Anaerolineae bacterium]
MSQDSVMTDSQERIRQAQALYRSGDQAGAKAALAELLKDDPQNAEAWYNAAQMAASPEQTVKLLRRALYVDPFHEEADAMLARMNAGAIIDESPPPPVMQAAPVIRRTPQPEKEPKQGKMGMIVAIIVVALVLIGLLVVLAGRLAPSGTDNVVIPTLAPLPTGTNVPVVLPTQPPQMPTATLPPTLEPTLAPYNFTATAYREVQRTQESDLSLTGTAAAQTYAPSG